jgi:hypothetical protein
MPTRKAGIWLAACLIVVAALAVFGCERNKKLAIVDGDLDQDTIDGDEPDGDGDSETDLDGDGEGPLVGMAVSKWIMAQNSRLFATGEGRVYMAAKAGLVGLEYSGTPGDREDDAYLIHHELSLPEWPTADLTGLCRDASGWVWVSTKTGLLAIDDGGTFSDPSDDRSFAPDLSAQISGAREILGLFCQTEGAGVWAATTAGFVIVLPDAEQPEILENWTILDYSGQSDALGVFPNAFARDANGVIWVTAFEQSAFALYAVETGAPATADDDTVHAVAYGFAEPKPSVLAADGAAGVWIIDDKTAWHMAHKGTLGDDTDDVWTKLPVPSGVAMNGFIPIGPNAALALEEGDRDVYFVSTAGTDSTADDLAVVMAGFGANADNPLFSAAYDAEAGLWYSTRYDVGLLAFSGGDLPDAGWTALRFPSLGAVPGNDLSGFVADADGVWLGGPNGLVKATYEADTPVADFIFTGFTLERPDSPEPFNVATLLPLEGGILAGGAYLAWLNPEGAFTVWNARSAPENVNLVASGPDGALLVSTLLRTIATIVGFKAYDYNGTPANPNDDDSQNLDNAHFGFASGFPVQTLTVIEGCRCLVGTIEDLSYWDCNGTPLETNDDILEPDLVRARNGSTVAQNIKQVTVEASGGAWFISKDGLRHLDLAGTPEAADDTLTEYDIPRIAASFAMDADGRLYYFMERGFMIHDPKGTPGDPTDDQAAILDMATDTKAQVRLDAFNNVWFSYGDGSGVFFGRLGELTFVPLADALVAE